MTNFSLVMVLLIMVLMVLVFKAPRLHFFKYLMCSIFLILFVAVAVILLVRAFTTGYSGSYGLVLSISFGLLIFILICVKLLRYWKEKSEDKSLRNLAAQHGHSLIMPLALIGLTLIYLVFELAFNARLLDVVGGEATLDEIHHIEHYGRILSGTAAALFMLQFLLKHDEKVRMEYAEKGDTDREMFGFPRILVACLLCVLGVYYGLQTFVDYLVDSRSGDFRHRAVNVSLIQNALVNDRVDLTGIDAGNGLYRLPEGKAFLALFPFMATSVDDLEQRMKDAKVQILRHTISEQVDPKTYFDRYQQAIQTATTQWQKYRGNIEDTESVDREFNKAWREYEDELCGHKGCRWTPDNVPRHMWKTVRRQVQKNVNVPDDWQPNDRRSFRAAIARQITEKMLREGITVDGRRIPPGLSQAEFIQHPAIQKQLRANLRLPENVRIPLTIGKSAFLQNLYYPMLQRETFLEVQKYNSDAASFESDGTNFEMGVKATQATLIPPIALFFSLLGAIGHLGKLSYLLAEICLLGACSKIDRPWAKRLQTIALHSLLLIPVGLFLFCWITLSYMENRVTRSTLYLALQKQLQSETLSKMIHVVAVGQGFAYPFDEAIRQKVLFGLDFGYQTKDKASSQAKKANASAPPSALSKEKPVVVKSGALDEASSLLSAQCRKMQFLAHRGDAAYPENSHSALSAAARGSWNGVETDVQSLSDGSLALHHDITLERTTNLTARTVRLLDSSSWKNGRMRDRQGKMTEESPALLEEVLPDIAASGKSINVEIKQEFQNCALATRTAHALMDALPPKARQMSAIQLAHLRCARAEDSRVYLGLVVLDLENMTQQNPWGNILRKKARSPTLDSSFLQNLKQQLGAPVGVHVDAYSLAANPALLANAAQLGISVMTYTLDDDTAHARQLRHSWKTQGRLPDGVIIDSTPETFCAIMTN
jgi:glycerophosphoryl diester phosphodiesterase